MRRIRAKFGITPSTIIAVVVLLIFGYCAVLSILWSTKQSQTARSGDPPLPADAKIMIPKILEHMSWNEGDKVLDYGCGNGAVGYYLIFPNVRKHHGHQYAVEYVASNLNKAKTSFPDPMITYAVGNLLQDADTFPYKDVKFDKIFAIYVFHLVHDLEELLKRYGKLLKTGGQIGFTTLTEDNVAFQLNLQMSRMPAWKEYMGHYEKTYYPSWAEGVGKTGVQGEKKIKDLFRRAGFRTIYLKIDTRPIRAGTVDALLDPLFWLAPTLEKVPISLVPDAKIEIRRLFTNLTGFPADATNFDIDNEYIMGVLEKI